MKLATILSTLKIHERNISNHNPDVEVAGVAHDTRIIKQGEVFIALSGGEFDGHQFIKNAIAKGAAAVVGEKKYQILSVPYIQVENSRLALAEFSATFYGYPAKELTVIGVTGTDGKTTTASLIHHILVTCGVKAGMVSTVNALIDDEIIDTGFHVTTPEAQMTQSLLRKMVDGGLTHVVLETTSHGLEQYRVAECYFDIGVVTNITHEHLDYHGDYEHYLRAKSKLFTGLIHNADKVGGTYQIAILNQDDISYSPLAATLEGEKYQDIKIIKYGTDSNNDLIASNIHNTLKGIAFDLEIQNETLLIESTLIGEYNAHNILAAIGSTVIALGLDVKSVIDAIGSFTGVPGRMERVDLGQNFEAIVDFAHTPNALKVALETSRNRIKEHVIAVFGSAGLRDREKRRMMAATSIAKADITILTAEDPRTEKLEDILAEMEDQAKKMGGVKGKTFFTIPDRGEAIRKAVNIAGEGDLVIICGKGHEQSMCFGEVEYHWDDRTAIKSALSDLLDISGLDMPYLPTQN